MSKLEQTTIYLPPELKKKLRTIALRNGTNMRKIIQEFVEEYVAVHRKPEDLVEEYRPVSSKLHIASGRLL